MSKWRRAVMGGVTASAAVLAAAVAAVPAAGLDGRGEFPTEATDVDGWTLEVDDEFEEIDRRRWTLKDNTYGSNEDSLLQASNCTIADAGDDGHALRLQAEKETVRRWGRTWRYTSCYATSEGKYSVPNYFRAQIRAKVPMEQGMWAAPMWFRPVDGSGGEIDLVETLGGRGALADVSQTIHSDYGPDHQQSSYSLPFSKLGDPRGMGWHTYSIEKLPGRITMWVDGVRTAHWSVDEPEWFARYYEVAKRWSLRVNLQVGGRWGGPPDETTDWSPDRTAVFVDRLRVWTPEAGELESPSASGAPHGDPDRGEPLASPPTGLTVTALSGIRAALVGSAPLLTWSAPLQEEAGTYELYRDGQLIGRTSQLWYVDASWHVDKAHVYRVQPAATVQGVAGSAPSVTWTSDVAAGG